MADIRIDGIKDVERLIHGEHESQNRVQVSVPSEQTISESRQVGDKWFDEDGNEWEQKDGYKLKLGATWQQELHDYLKSFVNCPKETCTCTFPKKLDEKMKAIHGMCFDCVLSMEHKIKIQGKWDEYEKGKLKANAYAWLKEAERDKDMIADELARLEFTNDFGDLEKWDVGTKKEQFLQKIEEEFEEFKKNFINALEGVEDEPTESNIEGEIGNT